MQKIAFIGGGNMATSIIYGLLLCQYSPHNITVSDPNIQTLEKFKQKFVNITDDNIQAIQKADIVILAIKPQILKTVITPLAPFAKDKLWISIAAGISVETIQSILGENTAIIRTMPNTPALVGRGVTGLYANTLVTEAQKTVAQDILLSIGQCHWFAQEDMLDVVTAISGSGPAYFFLFMETLQKAGERLGLTPIQARALVLQTALGSSELAEQKGLDFSTLCDQVTSKGGTTEKALQSLYADSFSRIVNDAVNAAYQRAQALKKGE